MAAPLQRAGKDRSEFMKEIREQIVTQQQRLDRLVDAAAQAQQDLGENELVLKQNRKLAQLLQMSAGPNAKKATDPQPDERG